MKTRRRWLSIARRVLYVFVMLGLAGEMTSAKTNTTTTHVLFDLGLLYGVWYLVHQVWIGYHTHQQHKNQ